MEREGVDEQQAAKLVDDTNKHREEWVRKHWSRAWRAHENYHLSVDTEWFGISGTVELVVGIARTRFQNATRAQGPP